MTRKHFIAIAHSLLDIKPTNTGNAHYDVGKLTQWKECCQNMADVCQSSNSRFNRAIFMAACGVE